MTCCEDISRIVPKNLSRYSTTTADKHNKSDNWSNKNHFTGSSKGCVEKNKCLRKPLLVVCLST